MEAHIQTTLNFDKTSSLGLLYGENSSHLRYLEDKLGINIRDRGPSLNIEGEERSLILAQKVLADLWAMVSKNQPITEAEIDAAIRFAANKPQHPEHNRRASDRAVEEIKAPGSGTELITKKKRLSARSPNQAKYIDALRRNDMVFGMGPAGTGKTYLAVAYGVELYENHLVDRLVFTRPAVEAGEKLGFLPGDMKEKVDPYLRPIYDALHDFLGAERVERLFERDDIEIAPLAFMRGRTLSNAFVLLDEAQNTTSVQMKMFLSRMGEGTKMVVTGDPDQTDLPLGETSGLKEAMQILQEIPEIAFIRFENSDVVRHKLVGKILTCYDKIKKARQAVRS